MKTIHNIDIKYGIAYFRIFKKKFFLRNEKMTNRKLGNLGNLGNIIPSFLISEFSILPYSKNRKLGYKYLGKTFPTFPRFLRFPSFRPGRNLSASIRKNQFVIFNPLSYCFVGSIAFDVKASFASRPESRLIR